jgi:hypothetical protein
MGDIMGYRNDYDYFELDNFDDGIDSRDYRRRQPQRRQSKYNGRPVYNVVNGRKSGRRRIRKRIRNRVIIVSTAIFLLIMLMVLLTVMFKGCSESADQTLATLSTDTKPVSGVENETKPPVNTDRFANLDKELKPSYFITPEIKDDNTMGESAYNIYVWNKQGYELFGSSEEKAFTYADTINGFANKLGDGVKVYDMVIPNHTEMGLPQRLKDSEAPSGSQSENIKNIYSSLSDKVTPINCYNYLAEHNDEYIYFGSDHHWTGLGAYYAYSAFAKSTEQDVLSLEDCIEHTIDGFTGSFINSHSGLDSDSVHYWEFPYDVTMDITYGDGTSGGFYDSPYYQYAEGGSNTYGVFLMGDNAQTVLKSSSPKAEEGKKIAIVKESYGNALAPYFTYNYQEVHVIDFRHFNGNFVDYCKENGIEEVLFANGVMSANTQIQLDSMSGLFP